MSHKQFRYLDIITGLFVAVLLISSIADTKAISIGFLSFGGGTFLFPVTYIFGDILTEVYGFVRARRVIWIGFTAQIIMAFTFLLVGFAPASSEWKYQNDFMNILGLTPRITLGSIIAYLFGEFVNSVSIAKMKVMTKGKYLWIRTIGSTVVGQLVDTTIFMFIAFYGIFTTQFVISIIFSGYVLKVITEVLFTPVTYYLVNRLKKAEHEDYFDDKTVFLPV